MGVGVGVGMGVSMGVGVGVGGSVKGIARREAAPVLKGVAGGFSQELRFPSLCSVLVARPEKPFLSALRQNWSNSGLL